MPRYATINFSDGYIDGELETNAPFTVAEIARAIMTSVDPHEAGMCTFTEIGLNQHPAMLAGGCDVYQIPDDLDIGDGRDKGTIERVEACRRIGRVEIAGA